MKEFFHDVYFTNFQLKQLLQYLDKIQKIDTLKKNVKRELDKREQMHNTNT